MTQDQDNHQHYQEHLNATEQDPISIIASMAEQINICELQIIELKERIKKLEQNQTIKI